MGAPGLQPRGPEIRPALPLEEMPLPGKGVWALRDKCDKLSLYKGVCIMMMIRAYTLIWNPLVTLVTGLDFQDHF